MAHVIELASGAFMSSLSVKGDTKSCEEHERDQQCGESVQCRHSEESKASNRGQR